MLHRRDSPWYPSFRLFRQRNDGDWQSAIAEIQSNLFVDFSAFGWRESEVDSWVDRLAQKQGLHVSPI